MTYRATSMHQTEDVEALAARYTALGTVWHDARQGDEEALESVRRIARSLEPSLEMYAAAEVVSLARRIADAGEGRVQELVPRLLEGIREILGGLPRDLTRVLVVEDDDEQATLLRRILDEPNREIQTVATGTDAEAAVHDEPPDLVVLDLRLPDSDGRDFLLALRSRPSTAAIPVIVVSSRSGASVRAECFALGADEFLEKPVEPEIFEAAVAALLRRTAALRRMAQEDHLTGLPNRAAFSRIFQRLQALAERNDEPLSLGLLDVDFLKHVNDRYGHAVGDRLLRDLSVVVPEALRDSDVLARWGGDEFVVLLPSTDPRGAREAVDKARRSFRETVSASPELGVEDALSFSAGITVVERGESVEEAVARADRLLYRAKAAGRDSVLVEDPGREIPERHVLVVEDEDAVARVFLRFLEQDGFSVRRAASGEEAMTLARQRRPDLVVLDIMLPGDDGFQVLGEIRKDEALRDVPVLIITGLGQDEAVARGFELGVDEYLVKPVSREDFLGRVRRLLRPT